METPMPFSPADAARTTLSFEIELSLEGRLVPYRPATWNDPAEGGEVEDLAIADAGVITRKPEAERKHTRDHWKTTSFMQGVDTSNPEVQKLLDNLLNLVWDDAQQAIVDEEIGRAA
jgi:hypothetical protein